MIQHQHIQYPRGWIMNLIHRQIHYHCLVGISKYTSSSQQERIHFQNVPLLGSRNSNERRSCIPNNATCGLWELVGRRYSSSSQSSISQQQLPPGYTYRTSKSKVVRKTNVGNTSTPSSSTDVDTSSNSISSSNSSDRERGGLHLLIRAGLPFVLFSVLAAWVVGNALNGKLKEMEASQGKTSISLRQAAVAKEHDEMVERLNTIVAQDFDNTKRIKRPEEILEERRIERQRRNALHRRLYRWVFQVKE